MHSVAIRTCRLPVLVEIVRKRCRVSAFAWFDGGSLSGSQDFNGAESTVAPSEYQRFDPDVLTVSAYKETDCPYRGRQRLRWST